MQASGQLRIGGLGGVLGFDLPAVLRLAELQGYALEPLADLLPPIEAGLIAAMNEKRKQQDG